MRIFVYDVAAESGGALTVLNSVYRHAVEVYPEHEWIFVLSLPQLETRDNVVVVNFPEVKKSWLSRLRFDRCDAPKLIEKYHPDLVLNLQNIAVKCRCRQVVYMHQSLPFSEHKFSLLQDRRLWVYQNVIGRMIKRSCRKADEIVVQANWVKDAIVRQCRVGADKITVRPPALDLSGVAPYRGAQGKTFFYPANGAKYKNHALLVDACEILQREGIEYRTLLTLDGSESDDVAELKRKSEALNLKIEWTGKLPIEEVYHLYAETILVFPSYVESMPLPLCETRACGGPILASDTPFAREALQGYPRARFFDYRDARALAEEMKNAEGGPIDE